MKPIASPRLAFFRATDVSNGIGNTSWRIALYLPDYGLDTWIYVRGKVVTSDHSTARFISIGYPRVPLLGSFYLAAVYALHAYRQRIDVVVCDPATYYAGVLYKCLNPTSKLVLDVRSIPVELGRVKRLIMPRQFDFVFRSRFYDAVSVITPGMRAELDGKYHFIGRYPTVVWDSGYDDAIFKPDVAPEPLPGLGDGRSRFIIMFHGSLSHHRGLFEAIRAVHLLERQGMHDLKLALIGSGAAAHDLNLLARRLDLEDAVLFYPAIPHENLPPVLACAHLGIDLLPDHPWWRHQSSLKVQEYLAMGKPVLATDLPAHRHISEAVMLVPDNQPETVAEAILKFRRLDGRQRDQLTQAALSGLARRTWRAKAGILANFIKEDVLT